jgi:dTDP-4-dehydrorhamnose 3,5-epimerase-like enzyme
MPKVASIRFQKYEEDNGFLCVYESGQLVPFEIKRVFSVSAKKGDVRGDHAHRKCTQLLVCTSGKIHVACDDGSAKSEHLLDGMEAGLLIPPGIWSTQEYLVEGTVLMVLCDRGYEATDYIRDYNDFKSFLQLRQTK